MHAIEKDELGGCLRWLQTSYIVIYVGIKSTQNVYKMFYKEPLVIQPELCKEKTMRYMGVESGIINLHNALNKILGFFWDSKCIQKKNDITA